MEHMLVLFIAFAALILVVSVVIAVGVALGVFTAIGVVLGLLFARLNEKLDIFHMHHHHRF